MKYLKQTIVLIVPFLQLVALLSCSRSTDTFVKQQSTDGFDEIILLNGDTICVPPHLQKRDNAPLRKGMFIHYHKMDDSIKDFFAVEDIGIIEPHVHECVENDTFMLIDQKSEDSVFGKYTRIYYNDTCFFSRREYDTVTNWTDRHLMMQNSNKHSFWIIGIKTADVYGPFTFDDYLTKKNELGVPATLKLKYETQKNSGEEKRKDAIQEDDFWGVIHRCLELVMKFIRK